MRASGLLALLALVSSSPLTAQDSAGAPRPTADAERLYVNNCARCHGVGGTGGLGPALRQPKLRRGPTDEAIVRLILNGIPGTAMVGFWNLSEDDARSLTAYVRALGRFPPEIVPGDPSNGRAIYLGSGKCGDCHILDGVGAGWAPDLTDVGRRLNAATLRQALEDPGSAQPVSPLPSVHGPYPRYLAIEATTATGRVVAGTRVAEDDFALVVRATDGRLVSLEKSTLRRLTKLPDRSPMPAYGNLLTATELQDLVAFLSSLKGDE
jgi:putative heme-binding domain-containing protein